MTPDAWLTLAVIGLCLGMLIITRYPPDQILLGGLTLLLVGGVLTPE